MRQLKEVTAVRKLSNNNMALDPSLNQVIPAFFEGTTGGQDQPKAYNVKWF